MTNNKTLTWRVTQLEKTVDKFDEKLDVIMENHLPHLSSEVNALKTRINVLSLVNVGAIILALIINRFL